MNLTLENESLRIEIDKQSGAVIGLFDKRSDWQIIGQPLLSQPFRLLVPLPDHRNNRAEGASQTPPSIEQNSNDVILRWSSVETRLGGPLPIEVQIRFRLEEDHLHIDVGITNSSPHTVEEVWTPVLGGVQQPEQEASLECLSMHLCGGFVRTPLGDGFPTELGYWGTHYPTILRSYPSPGMKTPFVLLGNGKSGVYIGAHGEPEILNVLCELVPGYMDSRSRRVPRQKDIGGRPAGVVASAARLPFIQPGESRQLAPLVLRSYRGDWHEGMRPFADFHRPKASHEKRPAWVRDVQSWLTVHLNSPEGCCWYRYADLPRLAQTAKDAGIGAMQVLGWAIGGQDGREPYQDTDPMLGTREELIAAIREVQAMGVRVLLMCKFKWADANTKEYEEEMKKFALRDIHGRETFFDGYGYQTLAQFLTGGSRRTGVGLCHLSEEFRKVALREWEKILSLSPDGILYDELSNHMALCFDESHGHGPGAPHFRGSIKMAESFENATRAQHPDTLMCGEGPADFLTPYYHLNYIRTWDGTGETPHTPAWKYLDPDMLFATCVTGFDDRELINQCICYGYIICYEPLHFKGLLEDFPLTVQYGRAAQDLREKLREYLWEGDFCHTQGAEVSSMAKDAEMIYSIFRRKSDGNPALVIANQGIDPVSVQFTMDDLPSASFQVQSPENLEPAPCGSKITIPARSLVVVTAEQS